IVAVLVVAVGVVAGWANGFEAALGFSAGMIFVVLFTQIAVKEERARNKVERLADELGRANQKLRQYAVQAEELATTQERNRLAREIHDSLGHYLTVINVQLEAARAVLPHNRAQALDALGKAQTLTQEGLREVRRSVAALRASPLEKRTLPEAVQALADECRAAGIATGLTITGPRRHLPPQAKLALYRAAQEGLTNVRKHSGATRTHLTLDYSDPTVIRLTVQDNGTGPSEPGVTTGFGLLGVRERIELLGGRVDTQAQPGQGFTLMVETPTNTGGSPDEQPAD
ncbi:MAG: sensor histidine kinase, partial [Anaerolineae bacterium]